MHRETKKILRNSGVVWLLWLSAIVVDAKPVLITIETKHTALVIKADTAAIAKIIYFGKKLANDAEYALVSAQYNQGTDYSGVFNASYTSSGTHNLLEPAIALTHSDGNTSLELQYSSHQITKQDANVTLYSVVLKDPVYPVVVTSFYKVYFNEDVVEQWTEIKHTEKSDIVLHKYASANLYLMADSYWLRHYHGDWAREMQPEETRLTHGIKTLDSKLGTRANLYQPPTFMLSLDKPATEDDGAVLYGQMEWSGNFRIDLEVDPLNNLRIIAGLNNSGGNYYLKANENLGTPRFLYTLSVNGKEQASYNLHSWARQYRIANGKGERMTVMNNWESTFFDFNETKLAQLMKDTKALGVELFLLDDGWFGNKYPRSSDNAGLGDWQENKQKLPGGIGQLIKEATANGIRFGIWLEPEMVNPKSELYEQHPDWIIKQPKRPEHLYRNQLVLDLSNPTVQNFVFTTIDNLLTKNPSLAYIKWDCNAVIYNAYSAHLLHHSHLYIEYVNGLYNLLKKIRAKYPDLTMMLCSGGGGRVDYAALEYFQEFWPSDNTDPLERVFIQWEYSYFYPAIASANHITDWGKQPIKYKADVAMSGKLGFDMDIAKLSEQDKAFCKQTVEAYNGFKELVWHGHQYRLASPWVNNVASLMYTNQEQSKAVLFSYLVNNRYGAGSANPIRLKGLAPDKKYTIQEVNLYKNTRPLFNGQQQFSGDFLMTVGLNPMVNSGRTSSVIVINEVK